MLNCAIIMGRLTADPELKTTSNGTSITRFTVAVDRNFTPQGQEKQADFINCIAWRQSAEFITKYFHKGSMIAIQGEIRTGSYTAQDGSKRYTTEIQVDRANFCGSKADSGSVGNSDRYAPAAPQQNAMPSSYQSAGTEDFNVPFSADDDGLPF